MKKVILALSFILILFPITIVKANDDVIIKSISVMEKSRDDITADSSFNNHSVSFDLGFRYETDYVKYKMIIENKNSSETYRISISDSEDDAFSYKYTNNDLIYPGTEEEIIIEVQYKDEVAQNLILSSGNSYMVNRSTEFQVMAKSTTVDNITNNNVEKNPLTKSSYQIIIALVICSVFLIGYFIKRKKSTIVVLLLVIGMCLSQIQPLMVMAEFENTITFYMHYLVTITPHTYLFEYEDYFGDNAGNCSDYLNEQTVEDIYGSCTSEMCDIYFNYYDGRRELITDRNVATLSDFYGYYTCHGAGCLSGEMEVEVLDKKSKKKKKKKLKDINDDDLLLAWNFDEGCYEYVPALFIKKLEMTDIHVLLTFDDGSTLDVVGVHRIFNLDQNFFADCALDEETPIGMRTINKDGKIIRLVSKETIYDNVISCCVVTEKCFNFYANGILTSVTLSNLYPISDMKYVKEEHDTFSFDELEIDKVYYDKLRFSELAKDFLRNETDTKKFIHRYVNRMKEQNIIKSI